LTLQRHENKNVVVLKCSPDRSITLFTKSDGFLLTVAVLKINDAYFQCYLITDAQLIMFR